MSPPALKTVYCCVIKANRVVYSYNSAGDELDALASICLQNAPSSHRWYFHTVRLRTYGFLMADGYTYFAIVDPSLGNLGVLQFLEKIRDAYRKAPRSAPSQDELISVIKHLLASLDYRRQLSLPTDESCEENDASPSPSTKQPLLGNCGHSEKSDDLAVRVDVPPEPAVVAPLPMRLGSNRARVPLLDGRELWWSHAKIIVVVDIVLCLLLFVAWLGICSGFRCVSQ